MTAGARGSMIFGFNHCSKGRGSSKALQVRTAAIQNISSGFADEGLGCQVISTATVAMVAGRSPGRTATFAAGKEGGAEVAEVAEVGGGVGGEVAEAQE